MTVVEKRVLILGSGFSNEVGALAGTPLPVTSDLIQQAEENISITERACPNFWKWRNEIKNSGLSDNWDIEKLYDMAAIAEEMHEHLWVNGTPMEAGILRAEIERLISLFFLKKSDQGTIEKTVHFTEKLLMPFNPTSILSTNWDGLLEPVIENPECRERIFKSESQGEIWGFTPDWVLEGNEFKKGQASPRSAPIHMENAECIKLHGSITWMICKDNGHLIRVKSPRNPAIFESGNDRLWDGTFRCPEDHSKLDFLLLPPASNKNYSKRPFPELWRKAFRLLTETHVVHLIGCALRPADFRLNDLLMKAIMARGGSPLKVLVTDTDKGFKEIIIRLTHLGIQEKQIEEAKFPRH